MMLSSVILLIIIAVIVQLKLCFGTSHVWLKMIPAALIVLGEIACGIAYAVSLYLDGIGKGIYGAAFAAVIYAIVLLIMLAAVALAWGLYAIVKTVQKRRK